MVTKERLNLRVQVTQERHKEAESILAQREQENKKDTLAQMGISLDRAVTLDEAYLFATDVLRFSVTKEEMQEDMNVHAKYGQLYTWNDFVSPPKQLNRNTFFDYTAGLCSMLAN